MTSVFGKSKRSMLLPKCRELDIQESFEIHLSRTRRERKEEEKKKYFICRFPPTFYAMYGRRLTGKAEQAFGLSFWSNAGVPIIYVPVDCDDVSSHPRYPVLCLSGLLLVQHPGWIGI